MLVEIATFQIDIDNSLLNSETTEKLAAFRSQHSSDMRRFSIKPLKNSPPALQKTTERAGEHYYEDEYETLLYNNRSICRFCKTSSTLEVAPSSGFTDPSFSIMSELKLFIAQLSIEAGGLLFHAAGLTCRNMGYLFTGHSGAGKSTLTELLYPEMQVINDDIIVLIPENDTLRMHSTPFGVKRPFHHSPFAIPVRILYNINKGIETRREPQPFKKALLSVLSGTCVFPTSNIMAEKVFTNVTNVVSSVPCFDLWFSKNEKQEVLLRIITEELC
jgi:hypothetical protein